MQKRSGPIEMLWKIASHLEVRSLQHQECPTDEEVRLMANPWLRRIVRGCQDTVLEQIEDLFRHRPDSEGGGNLDFDIENDTPGHELRWRVVALVGVGFSWLGAQGDREDTSES